MTYWLHSSGKKVWFADPVNSGLFAVIIQHIINYLLENLCLVNVEVFDFQKNDIYDPENNFFAE